MLRGLTARIDLKAAMGNLERIARAAGGRPVIAVVKADAYGHGAVELSRAFIEAGATTLAVAFVSEARELRESGITAPILVLFDRSEIPAFFDLGLTPVIHDMKTAREFSEEAARRGRDLPVHVKIDTGMGRMGLERPADVSDLIKLPGIECVALMSHLSDADLADPLCSIRQVEKLNSAAADLFPKSITLHMANSAAVFSCPEAHMDAVRPGIALYGTSPFDDANDKHPGTSELEPVMSVSAKVLTVRRVQKGNTISYGRTFTAERDTLAAVLAMGYADGYNRALSGQAHVLLRGQRARIAGRVCMDLTVADVTDIEGVSEGDEAVLLGRQGTEKITSHELAKMAGTIPYEILTSLGARARRVFN